MWSCLVSFALTDINPVYLQRKAKNFEYNLKTIEFNAEFVQQSNSRVAINFGVEFYLQVHVGMVTRLLY